MTEDLYNINSEFSITPVVIPTGVFAIDFGMFKNGGLPTTKKIEIFGAEGCGKTTLAMRLAKNTIDMGGYVRLYDVEQWDINRMKQVINEDEEYLKSHIFRKRGIRTIEDIQTDLLKFLRAYEANKSDKVWTIILDSLAFAVPQEYINAADKEKDPKPGAKASVLTRMFAILSEEIADKQILFIFINQPRTDLSGQMNRFVANDKYKTASSKAFLHFCDARVELKVGKREAVDGLYVGHEIKVSTSAKNKIAEPIKDYKYLQYYSGQIGNYMTYFELAMELGLLTQKGSWYKYTDKEGVEHSFQGATKFNTLDEKVILEIRQKLIDDIRMKFLLVGGMGDAKEL